MGRLAWAPALRALPQLAAPSPMRIFMPAHYMRGFHADYASSELLEAAIEAQRVDDWQSLHMKMSRTTRPMPSSWPHSGP